MGTGMTVKVTKGGAVVDHGYFYRHMELCPHGSRVVLLNQGNSATLGTFTGKEWGFKGWSPLPKIPDWMRPPNYDWRNDEAAKRTTKTIRQQVEEQIGCRMTDREFSFYMLGRSQS